MPGISEIAMQQPVKKLPLHHRVQQPGDDVQAWLRRSEC